MLDPHPRQNQKARVVGEKANVASPRFHAPTDEAIAAAEVSWCRTPGQTGERASACPDQILQMFADWLLVPEIVMLLDQTVEQRLVGAAANLLKLNRTKFAQPRGNRCLVQQDRRRARTPRQRIVPLVNHRRQIDLAGSLQHQQQTATDHVAQCAIGLPPLPGFAQLGGECPPAGSRVCRDQFPDEDDVFRRNDAPAVFPLGFHLSRIVRENFLERKPFSGFSPFRLQLTARHTGAALVSGFPAASNSWAWCACKLRVASWPVGHQRKRPFDRRFCATQNPCPSNASSLIAVARRPRKMKRHPEKGSAPSFSRHNCARPSMPLRRSTGSMATRTRICGAT